MYKDKIEKSTLLFKWVMSDFKKKKNKKKKVGVKWRKDFLTLPLTE